MNITILTYNNEYKIVKVPVWKFIVGKWRLFWHLCPECNSDAPKIDTCNVCCNDRESFYHWNKKIKNQWWRAYLLNILREQSFEDYVLQVPTNIYGQFIPAGTLYKQINGDWWYPVIGGARCPAYKVHFTVIKNNPQYFKPNCFNKTTSVSTQARIE